jgi:SAM-dependent methyltransferase
MNFRKKIQNACYRLLDSFYVEIDKKYVKRTNNIKLIPGYEHRRGGKVSYGEWAHVIGIFQTLLFFLIQDRKGVTILDIGCGTGLIGIAAHPFVLESGKYIGMDVRTREIEFCKANFKSSNYEFIHFDVHNARYANDQQTVSSPWNIESNSVDFLTALSVWTHMNEKDANFYLSEVARVLKGDGKAIITFFYLDEHYRASLEKRKSGTGRYHSTQQRNWIFDKPAYSSSKWFTPKWTKVPEDAIGVTESGFSELLQSAGLKVTNYYPGNWKENQGLYFQDVFILEKES